MELSFEQMEERFPESTVAWDRDGGPEWTDGHVPSFSTICDVLSVWYQHRDLPYGSNNVWGFWIASARAWNLFPVENMVRTRVVVNHSVITIEDQPSDVR